jgi:hypothetical protein
MELVHVVLRNGERFRFNVLTPRILPVSIYATWLCFDDEVGDEEVGSPHRYRGSHAMPAEKDERDGYVDVAAIPSYVRRDAGAPAVLYDWLRLSVGEEAICDGACVLLTRDHVIKLRDTLTAWLEREPEDDE